jgi:HPt (histidine-containing phosphotransfer) domain-containing protein
MEYARSPVDLSELRLLFGDDPAEFASFCREIADALARTANDLGRACSNREWAKARAKAHELRGLSGNAGALDLSERCAGFERLVENEPAAAVSHLRELSTACHEVCGTLLGIAARGG